jgi:hypothetical protein
VREVVQAPDGALWVTTSNCDGRGSCPSEKDVIARIVPLRERAEAGRRQVPGAPSK